MPEKYPRCFKPGKIGKLALKNRLVLAPVATRFCGPDCMVPDNLVDYLGERARGGAGMVVMEAVYPSSLPLQRRPGIWDDKFIPGLRRIVEAVHAGEAVAAIQINPHCGRRDKYTTVSASLTVNELTGRQAVPLDIAGIQQIIRETGEGCRRAKEAGFDAIMLHGAHGYLVQEFMSPLTNKRNDAYGGDFDRRNRLAIEIVKLVRATVGPDFPLMYRLFGDERVEGGLHLEDTLKIGQILQDLGIDALDITSGSLGADEWVSPSMYMPVAGNSDLAAAFKKKLKIPIIVVGRIKIPEVAENVLAEGKADFINMGRALLADPFMPQKMKEGRPEDIRRCISCLKCSEAVAHEEYVHCAVNPEVGREAQFRFKPGEKHGKIVVVGGGPAGMEAAALAARRGFTVSLIEAGPALGGQLDIGSKPPAKEDLAVLSAYLARQMTAAGVKVKLNTKASVRSITAARPDAVIIASGVTPAMPKIKGLECMHAVSYAEVLSGAKLGQKVVVIGGGLIGCEVALFLRQQGKEVTIIEVLPELAADAFYRMKKIVVGKVLAEGIKVFTCAQGEEAQSTGVMVKASTGEAVFVRADDIVIACGSVANAPLFDQLQGKVDQLYKVGDCVKPRSVLEATREGADAAFKLS